MKEFYILTTAIADERLQQHVRHLNEARKKLKKFPVEVLFWTEIVRRVARFEQVAQKHFPIGGSKSDFSPLLATWYTTDGRLELTGEDWQLAVSEIGEDFHEWPSGRVVVRQRETDAIMAELRKLDKIPAPPQDRAKKIELRRKLRYMQHREYGIQEILRMLYTNERLKFYMLDLDETGVDAQEILQAIIEFELARTEIPAKEEKIRLSPPTPDLLIGPRSSTSVADSDIPVNIPSSDFIEILNAEHEFPNKYYGNPMVQVVSELPDSVRRRFAIPAIIRRIDRIMHEDRKTLAEMQIAGYLDLNMWKYTY